MGRKPKLKYGSYADNPDFRPYIVTFPVPEGTEVKGAVLICAEGAFQFRSDQNEGTPVAQALSELGFRRSEIQPPFGLIRRRKALWT